MKFLGKYLKDYKKELVSPAATPKVVDVSTMSGKIGQLSKELLHLEDKGKGFGDSEYDATAVALKRAQEALAAYKSELFKTDEQRQKEAKSVRKQQEAQEKLNQKLQEAKEKEAVRCRELRDYLYEDFREGIISKEDYKELHDGYTEKRKKAEEAVRSIDQQISEVLESKSDKYHWLDYFAEHQNIQELTRTVAVELIDQILVYDKKHIEVRFNFDDCYQSLLRQIQSVGCDVNTGMDGRIEIQKREVV